MNNNTCKIKYESKSSEKVPIVSFANGKLLECAKENVKFECFEHKIMDVKSPKKSKKIIVAESNSNKMQYVGFNFGENAPRSSSLQSYYVGVLSKRTGKMKVYQSDFFQLKPYLQDSTQTTNVDALNSSFKDRNDLLVSAFGGKKKRKAMEARKRYSVHDDSLENSVTTSMESAKILSNQVSQESSPEAIPPQNKEAQVPEEIYDIKTIISDSEYNELDDFISELGEADKEKLEEWKKSGEHSEYVINAIPGLPKNAKIRKHKLKLLAYFDLIVKMLKLKYTDLRKKDPIPNIPDPLKNYLLNKFTISTQSDRGSTSRSMGQKMKDKAISYALVIALFLENFSIDLNKFQVDFKMSSTKLTVIGGALGCYCNKKVVKGTTTTIAELKLPLFNPSLKKFSGRK